MAQLPLSLSETYNTKASYNLMQVRLGTIIHISRQKIQWLFCHPEITCLYVSLMGFLLRHVEASSALGFTRVVSEHVQKTGLLRSKLISICRMVGSYDPVSIILCVPCVGKNVSLRLNLWNSFGLF